MSIGLADVRDAALRIRGVAHRTPVISSSTLDKIVGAHLLMKAENLQRAGAFKFRGAYNCISQLSGQDRSRGILTCSSGNHAQAVALVCATLGCPATILMPHDAPISKRRAAEGYGATVIEFDRYKDDREELTREHATTHGLTVVHAYDDWRIIAGAGTAALELFEDVGPFDVLVVPVGGGGLLAGSAITAHELHPDTKVVGVEPEATGGTARSFAAGHRVAVEVRQTIADGQQLRTPGERTFQAISAFVDAVVTVTDEQILAAMTLLFDRTKLVVEPSGATGFAAVLAGLVDTDPDKTVGVMLSGGNIDTRRFAQLYALLH